MMRVTKKSDVADGKEPSSVSSDDSPARVGGIDVDIKKLHKLAVEAEAITDGDFSAYLNITDIEFIPDPDYPRTDEDRECFHITSEDHGPEVTLCATFQTDPIDGFDFYTGEYDWGSASFSDVKSVCFGPSVENCLIGVQRHVQDQREELVVYAPRLAADTDIYPASFLIDYKVTLEVRVDQDIEAVRVGRLVLHYR